MADDFTQLADQIRSGNQPTSDFSALADQARGKKLEAPTKLSATQYLEDTLSNFPGSAAKLAGNIGHSIMHPVETAQNIGNVVAGTVQNMNPSSVPGKPGGEADFRPHANAAWDALKKRYGSVDALLDTVRTDPVGFAADVSAVAGGGSALARGGAAAADAANLSRTSSTLGKVADTAATVSDATNPVNLVTKPIGAALKGTGRGLVRAALPGIGGRTERYGATPAQAVLEETSGIKPSKIKQSALKRLSELDKGLDDLITATGNPSVDLTTARQVISDEIDKIRRANSKPGQLTDMQDQLTVPQPGFAGAVTPAGDVAAQQDARQFRAMKGQFRNDWTKFDAGNPKPDQVIGTGNRAYHEMAQSFDRAVPGAEGLNQQMQNLSPVPVAAQKAAEQPGLAQRLVTRATRPTGAMAPTLAGGAAGGPLGAAAVLGAQEALGSPAIKMGMARGAYGAGKALASPIASRGLNAAGVASEPSNALINPATGWPWTAEELKAAIPKFAHGGVITRPTLLVDAATMKPSGIMAEQGPERITPLAGIGHVGRKSGGLMNFLHKRKLADAMGATLDSRRNKT